MARTVLICCHQTCPKQGSTSIFTAFQTQAPTDVTVIQAGCFRECGSGPMVKVLPDNIWYAHVQIRDVPTIVQQHLVNNQPVKAKLYTKFHPIQNRANPWLLVFVGCFGFFGLLFGLLASQTDLF